jgi:glycyl-tRNA synthetase beta chain
VLKARLADAAFFYQNDLKTSFNEWNKKLKSVVFHTKLGTLADKTNRLKQLAPAMTTDRAVQDTLKTAAIYAKGDLMSEMVFEFPELQGIMGSYYAQALKVPPDVAQAIYAQYTPKGPQDQIPTNLSAQLFALMDRLDTLVGFFSVGVEPTGSKDPFALRRTALGIIRLLETNPTLCLSPLLSDTYDLHKSQATQPKDKTLTQLTAFIRDRLKVYWRDQGYKFDHVDAVLPYAMDLPLSVTKTRLSALDEFLKDDTGAGKQLLAAYKRSSNILVDASLDGAQLPDPALFKESAEESLFNTLSQTKDAIAPLLDQHQYKAALGQLAMLRPQIDAFFDQVKVNVDDPTIQKNRLYILKLFQDTLHHVAQFSKIEG